MSSFSKHRSDQKINFCQSTLMTPVGKLFITCSSRGVSNISYPNSKSFFTSNFAISNKDSSEMKQIKKELTEYFEGRRKHWEMPIDWGHAAEFYLKVRKACAKIPYGQTTSYKDLSKKAGNPQAARAVGTAMSTNPLSIIIPCHRVVRCGGNIGNYGGGVYAKLWLIRHEQKVVDSN